MFDYLQVIRLLAWEDQCWYVGSDDEAMPVILRSSIQSWDHRMFSRLGDLLITMGKDLKERYSAYQPTS